MHAGAAKKQSSHRDYRVGGARKKSESAPFYVNVKIRMYIFFNLRMYKNIKISVYELLFLRKIIL